MAQLTLDYMQKLQVKKNEEKIIMTANWLEDFSLWLEGRLEE